MSGIVSKVLKMLVFFPNFWVFSGVAHCCSSGFGRFRCFCVSCVCFFFVLLLFLFCLLCSWCCVLDVVVFFVCFFCCFFVVFLFLFVFVCFFGGLRVM